MPNRQLLKRRTVGHFGFFGPGAAGRIVEAVGYPLVEPLIVADLQRALELITPQLVLGSFLVPPQRTDPERVQRSFDGLLRAIGELQEKDDFPPPVPPADWVQALENWRVLQSKMERTRPAGRPRDNWEHAAYAQLIGIYEYAFGRPASANNIEGPTARFLLQCLKEVGGLLRAAKFSNQEDADRVLARWSIPKPDALRKKIIAAQRWERKEREEKGWCYAWHNAFSDEYVEK